MNLRFPIYRGKSKEIVILSLWDSDFLVFLFLVRYIQAYAVFKSLLLMMLTYFLTKA